MERPERDEGRGVKDKNKAREREGDQTMPGSGTDTKLALHLIDSKR